MNEQAQQPWYRRTYRWGQTNLTEIDPIRFDLAWWRDYWRRTRVQGVIVNAGGIVAYYPSAYPLQHRAQYLGEGDLYGETVSAAHADGLVVLARMDSNRADERCYVEHPEWFARDRNGAPYREGELFVTCINSPYYDEYLPGILREIIARSQPEGVTDNSWSGLDRGRICYCQHCARSFRDASGFALPQHPDWESPAYRQWILWSYQCRLTVWDLNNRVTQAAGGPDCLWIGMNSGDVIGQAQRFRDYREICRRAEIIMLDAQARSDTRGFQANGDSGKLIHGLLGWEKLIPESTALYQAGQPTFRLASKPAPEARMWALEGFAGGISPWWHHIGAYHEDRRQYRTAEPLFRWHETNQEYLVNRTPVATVGVVWSQRCVDFYGRDAAEERLGLPQRGVANALLRARIPYLLVHADDIDTASGLKLLILSNLGALSDAQCASIRGFVAQGGGLLATGESSMYDEWGDAREDFALADLFGCHATGVQHGAAQADGQQWDAWARHSYLRLAPELRGRVDGPQTGDEPTITGERHAVLRGFEETDSLPFGGRLEVVRAESGTVIPLTYVPPFPIYPPETAWMRQPSSDVPALILNDSGAGRVAYLPADLDRRYGRDNLPDHALLLANLVRWATGEPIPLTVEGPGLLDCHLYRQAERLVLHLINLSGAGAWRAPMDEAIPVGPFQVRLQLPEGVGGTAARLLVAEQEAVVVLTNGWAAFTIASIAEHEVVVVV